MQWRANTMGKLSMCMDKMSMRNLLQLVGGDKRPLETTSAYLWRIADVTGLHYRVVRAIWYGETLSYENNYKLKQLAKKNNGYIIDRLLWRRAVLIQTDAEFFADEIAYLDELADQFNRKKASGG